MAINHFRALGLVVILQSTTMGAASVVSDLVALLEIHPESSAIKQALIAELSPDGQPAATVNPTTPRQLQQQTATPLPPPSGTCPDVTGVQQALDEATARIAALEVYTDVSAAPRGLIAMWSGALDALPQGWALCDGTAGTPDLRDKFVVAAGSRYALGSSTNVGENVGASFSWVRQRTVRTNAAKRLERLDSVAGLCALDCVLLCVWYVCGFR
eukprot:COSAG02_NODE_7829_length_2831_cov_1.499268_1_plen_213_part_10